MSGETVSLRKGPFGFYVQLGEAKEGEKPKRCSLPRQLSPSEVTLDQGIALLALPREIGKHPEGGEAITAGIGRYGPYIKHGKRYCSLKGDDDVLSIGLNRAVAVLAETPQRGGANAGTPIGEHPADGQTGHPAQRPLRALCQARPPDRLPAQGHGHGRRHPGDGGRAFWPSAPPRRNRRKKAKAKAKPKGEA